MANFQVRATPHTADTLKVQRKHRVRDRRDVLIARMARKGTPPKGVVAAHPSPQFRVMQLVEGLLVHFTRRIHVAIGDVLDSEPTESAT